MFVTCLAVWFCVEQNIGRDCRLHGWRGSKSHPFGKPFLSEARSKQLLMLFAVHQLDVDFSGFATLYNIILNNVNEHHIVCRGRLVIVERLPHRTERPLLRLSVMRI